MENVIKELWYGNIIPNESGLMDTPDVKELMGYISRHSADLDKSLTEEQKEVLGKYTECIYELQSLSESRIFEYGFKLGAKMMLEMIGK